MVARISDFRPVRILSIVDEYVGACLAITLCITSQGVINQDFNLFVLRVYRRK